MAKSPEVKAKVIAEIIANQKSVRDIAKDNKVSVGLVQRWKEELGPKKMADISKAAEIDLNALIGTLTQETLLTLIEWQKIKREPKYVLRQNAADLAVMEGVMAGSVVKVIDAATRFHEAMNGDAA